MSHELSLAFLLALLPAAGTAREAPRSGPLDLVLILADDLGWSDLSSYGSDLHETPHIDQLAREGVRFSEAYAAAPVCTPTRASILTGKVPARLHMTTWYEASQDPPRDRPLVPPVTRGNLPHAEVTLAEALRATGYATVHVGKWHLGDAAHYPETQGFDVNIAGTFWGAPPTYFYPYRGLWSDSTEYRYVPDLEWGREGEYLTDRLTEEAIRAIERLRGRPFFLHLAYHSVHTPIEGKKELVEHYQRKLAPGLRHRNPAYAAMVHSLDENVGRLLRRIEELGLRERTVVAFTSDNGGTINRYREATVTTNWPLRSGKGSLYEGGIRVPLIIRWPGVTPRGVTCREPVISSDLYPTLLAAAGAGAAGGAAGPGTPLDGRSLMPLLGDPGARLAPRALFWHYPHYYPTTTPVSAVRSGEWKLLEFLEDGHVELYNLKDDTAEAADLASSLSEKTRELKGLLHGWREEMGAQMPARTFERRSE